MKYLILIAMLFVAGLLFLPRGAGTGIRNVPILIAILVVLFGLFVWSVLRSAVLKRRVRRALRRAGFVITKRHRSFLRNRLFAERAGEKYQILLLSKKRRHGRYHFDSADEMEFYRTVMPLYKVSSRKGPTFAAGAEETSRVGKRKLRWLSEDAETGSQRFVVFDRLPMRITDTVKSHDLGPGDAVCGSDVRVWDLPSFVAFLENVQTEDAPVVS